MSTLTGKLNGIMERKVMVSLKEMTKKKMPLCMRAAVKAADMRYLNEGDKLEFTLEDGPKGPSAVNLKKID